MDENFDPVLVKSISKWLGAGSINVFGRPYAGKDTQCKRLAKLLNGEIIAGGDITRNQGSKNLKSQTEAGFLAPTEEYRRLVSPYFKREEYQSKSLILNSIGRWSGEEIPIVKAAKEAGHPIKAVVFIFTDDETIRQRWTMSRQIGDRGKRYDDDKEKLDTRLVEFHNKSLPVIDFYRKQGLLIEINGLDTVVKVTANIIDKLALFVKNQKN